jgi:uncharacterized membrane protein YpjA
MKSVATTVRIWSDVVVSTPLFAYGLAGLNILGFFVGTVFWYGDFIQTNAPPLWAYPFIPDSPLSTLLFGLALILLHHHRSNDLLNQFAIVFNIKYGTWTMLFWSLYWMRTGDLNPVSLLMFATHLGMAVEGILLLQYVPRPHARNSLVILAWFILGDIVDYAPLAPGRDGYGWYPPLPLGTTLVPTMMAHAVLTTWALEGWLLVRSLRHPARVKHLTPSI